MAASVEKPPVRCLWVGDSNVGKTCLLLTYKTGIFPTEDEFLPSSYDEEEMVTIGGKPVKVHFTELPDSEDYKNIRRLEYFRADVVVVCFSVADRESFNSVKEKWLTEVEDFVFYSPVILLGTMIDLRQYAQKEAENRNRQFAADQALKTLRSEYVSTKQGRKMAKACKAQVYLECSSVSQENVGGVVEKVVRRGLRHQKVRAGGQFFSKPCCAIL